MRGQGANNTSSQLSTGDDSTAPDIATTVFRHGYCSPFFNSFSVLPHSLPSIPSFLNSLPLSLSPCLFFGLLFAFTSSFRIHIASLHLHPPIRAHLRLQLLHRQLLLPPSFYASRCLRASVSISSTSHQV
ncbi:unnamed protein product [Taenia asiatica]|uniref:Uncharacterized protein n=1 Tax=Taenia asiatica TaxID=60517 RepID=A0A0R3WG06_TAEAS|nr:unnamed protein product [Taenia asiatica]